MPRSSGFFGRRKSIKEEITFSNWKTDLPPLSFPSFLPRRSLTSVCNRIAHIGTMHGIMKRKKEDEIGMFFSLFLPPSPPSDFVLALSRSCVDQGGRDGQLGLEYSPSFPFTGRSAGEVKARKEAALDERSVSFFPSFLSPFGPLFLRRRVSLQVGQRILK